jgi:hypothetical protein
VCCYLPLHAEFDMMLDVQTPQCFHESRRAHAADRVIIISIMLLMHDRQSIRGPCTQACLPRHLTQHRTLTCCRFCIALRKPFGTSMYPQSLFSTVRLVSLQHRIKIQVEVASADQCTSAAGLS